ncbi:MAG: argininosuccinate synthase [Candidatus Korarchaeum sp.]|nr:argininosuccinate synthase [Candidatus Korarchaeum sp.]MDW8035949.1 argininosuccinate synthase [Candidatus Korarchaeum sp.]
MSEKISKVVLAYSGGLDTTVAIKWLSENGVEVVTFTAELGQGAELEEVEKRAYEAGSIKHYSFDLIDEFAQLYVAPAILANAMYEDEYPVSSSLSRPLIASKLVEIAEKEGADAVAHGCTSKGNDQVRFDVTVRSLNPKLKVIAPTRIWRTTRHKELEYASSRGLKIPKSHKKYSIDSNIWGRSIESGPLEDPWSEPPEDAFEWTVPPERAPDKPEYLTLELDRGIPVALNGERMPLSKLVVKLNSIAGKHGVGRIDHMESRIVGFKSREVYEAPAAVTIVKAHKDLEKAVLTRRELQFKSLADREWTNLVYEGLWGEPLRESLQNLIEDMNKHVCGEVRLKLFKGSFSVIGRRSNYALYDVSIAGYDEGWYPTDEEARGFIQAWGLYAITSRAVRRDVQEAGVRRAGELVA